MSDNYPVDPTELRSQGTRGIMAAGAGIGLWGVNTLLHIPVVGWIVGGGLIVLGAMGLFGKSKTDKVSGSVLLGAGALGIASIFLKGLTSFFLGVGGLALVGYGIWNIFKFVKGLRDRSR
jgi:hypothetical protein